MNTTRDGGGEDGMMEYILREDAQGDESEEDMGDRDGGMSVGVESAMG